MFRDIAEVPAGSTATVYEDGWQSWSVAGSYPASGTSPRPVDPRRRAMGHRPGRPAPPTGFQGEGLLAVDPGDGGPVRLWSATDPAREVPSIRARWQGGQQDGRVVVSADGDVRESSDQRGLQPALATWAEELARASGVGPVPSLPPVWCSWYHYFTSVREEDVLENLAAIDRLGLDVGIVQVDDGWQAGYGDWLECSPRFPGQMTDLANRIRATGRRAGIWTAPLLVGQRSQLAAEHPDWLTGGADAGHNWDQPLGALDVTHPDAAAHLQNVFRTLASWGYDYFKVDFLYAGAIDGRRHADATGVDAYRHAIRLIREGIGPEATLLGCGAPLLASVGLFDAMRVSPDVAPHYEPRDGDPTAPGQLSAVLAGRARAYQHARLWISDPDCLIVRPEVERREEWAAHVERWGGLRASSDRLEALDDWGLETTRRLLRPSSVEPLT
jgi:alpha-galactosidase